MRDGNRGTPRNNNVETSVVSLPMRDGNGTEEGTPTQETELLAYL